MIRSSIRRPVIRFLTKVARHNKQTNRQTKKETKQHNTNRSATKTSAIPKSSASTNCSKVTQAETTRT